MKSKKNKTPEYIRRSVDKYRTSHKYIQIAVPNEVIERMKAVNLTTADIRSWLISELERREGE